MQATVHRFDAQTGSGSVVTDAGLIIPFSGEVFAGSGLLHVRVGQRLTIDVGGGAVEEVVHLRLGTVGSAPQPRV